MMPCIPPPPIMHHHMPSTHAPMPTHPINKQLQPLMHPFTQYCAAQWTIILCTYNVCLGCIYACSLRINGEEMERSNAKVLSNIIALSNSNNDVGGVREQEAVNNVNGKIKRRAPAVLMEGSRCSRVNGRGWRCSQQTLIGYSLCEHHLGKGRLRSISSVRVKSNNNVTAGERKKKEIKIKIGAVKARSMSSLLDGEQDEDDDDRSVDAMATAEGKMGLV